jgi:hypothetical protein
LTSQQTLTEQLLVRNRVLERETDHQASQIQQLTTELASPRTTLQDVMSAFAQIEDRLPPLQTVQSPPRLTALPNLPDSNSKRPRQGDTPTRIAVSKSASSPDHSPDILKAAPMQLDSQFQITEYASKPSYPIQPVVDSIAWTIPSFFKNPIPPSPSSVQKTVHEDDSFHDTVTIENAGS